MFLLWCSFWECFGSLLGFFECESSWTTFLDIDRLHQLFLITCLSMQWKREQQTKEGFKLLVNVWTSTTHTYNSITFSLINIALAVFYISRERSLIDFFVSSKSSCHNRLMIYDYLYFRIYLIIFALVLKIFQFSIIIHAFILAMECEKMLVWYYLSWIWLLPILLNCWTFLNVCTSKSEKVLFSFPINLS